MVKILVADDHPVVRRGIREILTAEPDMIVTGEAADSHELSAIARREPWDVLILDLNMPGGSGLDVLQNLKDSFPDRPVLVLSMHPEEQFAVRVLRAGAAGYVPKGSAPEELVLAVRKVASGGRYVSASLGERLAGRIGSGSQPLHEQLSNREFAVLRRIASGQSVSEIANDLSLSVKTVSTYRARILQKMEMRHNGELTRYALEHNLAD
ncbi:MAG: response regulator transcription factor [Gemmatimonadota bacterium]